MVVGGGYVGILWTGRTQEMDRPLPLAERGILGWERLGGKMVGWMDYWMVSSW